MFIRIPNSGGGYWDVDLGAPGQALFSNGEDVAPSFQDALGETPGHFSYTQDWEQAELTRYGGYDFGVGNFTAEFERTAAEAAMPDSSHGPAMYTTASDIPWSKRV